MSLTTFNFNFDANADIDHQIIQSIIPYVDSGIKNQLEHYYAIQNMDNVGYMLIQSMKIQSSTVSLNKNLFFCNILKIFGPIYVAGFAIMITSYGIKRFTKPDRYWTKILDHISVVGKYASLFSFVVITTYGY